MHVAVSQFIFDLFRAHKANHITRQQQRAAALMSISAYTDSSYSSTNQRNPAVQSSVSMHGGGGARNTPTSCFQELAHLKPARSECFSGSPGGCSNLLKHGLHRFVCTIHPLFHPLSIVVEEDSLLIDE